ncbi:hypothetical protein DERP_006705 [Dermatophagoides pteronyssinus]|uniref:Uncharacterized protein n=1 Tax=Dermatophagoides pteronyssinus TaxID=6956 RepID=A0ABQ8IR45_DERPT|nr:hypothetical protein DERP_006705 [Dermatophagoides pteronyssinus]
MNDGGDGDRKTGCRYKDDGFAADARLGGDDDRSRYDCGGRDRVRDGRTGCSSSSSSSWSAVGCDCR